MTDVCGGRKSKGNEEVSEEPECIFGFERGPAAQQMMNMLTLLHPLGVQMVLKCLICTCECPFCKHIFISSEEVIPSNGMQQS